MVWEAFKWPDVLCEKMVWQGEVSKLAHKKTGSVLAGGPLGGSLEASRPSRASHKFRLLGVSQLPSLNLDLNPQDSGLGGFSF